MRTWYTIGAALSEAVVAHILAADPKASTVAQAGVDPATRADGMLCFTDARSAPFSLTNQCVSRGVHHHLQKAVPFSTSALNFVNVS